MTNDRPNIIIFNPDEMRADTLGHLGNASAVTPNIDALVRNDAVSFSNAFCQNPVCVPSRCSYFTGLYPHVYGHRTMGYLLHQDEDSLFRELKNSGYYVWMNSRNDLVAAQIPGLAESHADEIFFGGKSKEAPGPVNEIRIGKNFYSHFEGKLGLDEHGRNYSRDDEVVDAAIYRLKHPVDDRPVCIYIGLMTPHVPYRIEEPFYSAVEREKLPPRVKFKDCSGKEKMLVEIKEHLNMDDYTESDWNELRAVYQGMCMKVDAQFGRLLQALKDQNMYDDSAIFFLSDHGEFDGDYDLVEKAQNCFEDCLTRVPLIIKPPKSVMCSPGISSSLVELIDFYATVMDFSGTAPSHTQFGKSLRPILADRSFEQRQYVFAEGGRMPGEVHCDEFHSKGEKGVSRDDVYWPRKISQTDDIAHAKGIMIRDHHYKYVSRSLGSDEFYDLMKDPKETMNKIGDAKYKDIIIDMKEAMLKWLQGTCDIVPFQSDESRLKQ